MKIPVRVEIGFGSTWRTEPSAITWTNVSAYVLKRQAIRTRRGASKAWGEPDPGFLSLLLMNKDRRFDPDEPTSPHAGQLVAGVPIRAVAEPQGQDPTTLFTGFITGWPQRMTKDDGFHVVSLTAVDGFEKLATARLPRSYLETQIDGKPYFPMGDTSYEWESVNVPRTGRYTAQPGRAEILTEPGDLHPATRFNGNYLARYQANPLGGVALVEIDQSVETGDFLTLFDRGDRDRSWEASVSPDMRQFWLGVYIVSKERREARIVYRQQPWLTYIVVGGGDPEINPWSVRMSAPFSYSRPFTMGWATYRGFTFEGLLPRIYRDGEPLDMELGSWPSNREFQTLGTQVTVGGSPRPGDDWEGWRGSVAHVVLGITEPLSSGTHVATEIDAYMAAYHASVIGVLDGQRAGERLGWVADQVDWPTEARDLAQGRTRLGPVNPAERTALAYARLVDTTESGRLFVAADGTLTLHDRWRRWLDPSATTPQLNVTGSTGIYFQDIDRDPQSTNLMVNRASVSRETGRPQVRRNAPSIDTHGERGTSVSSMHRNDLGARGLASFIVGTRGDPLNVVEKISIPLHAAAPADVALLLGVELGDRINLAYESRGQGTPIAFDVIVEGLSHAVAGGGTEWWCELYLAPVPQRSPFIIGESLVGGPDVVTY